MKKLSIVCAFLMVSFLPCVTLASPIPDTGQTQCYNNSVEMVPCPSPGEAFYGQDGSYSINPHSFLDFGNGIVRDNVTGLEWQQATAPGTYTLQQALDYCDGLSLGGHDDWRLPTAKELAALMDCSIQLPGPRINTTYFPGTVAYYYRSSTTHGENVLDPDFSSCGVYGNMPWGLTNVRAVRSGQPIINNFMDNFDGTVTDTATGLMWQQATAPGYTWEEALTYCEGLSLAGHDDWRLPNRNELHSIVDYSTTPTIDTTYFPGTVAYYYRSSTTSGGSINGEWSVRFDNGIVGYNNKSYSGYVRAVRSGQCGSFGDSDIDAICDDGDVSGVVGDNPCTGGETVFCDDNCPNDYNPSQTDCDEDGAPDACDGDTIDNDGDGVDDGEGVGHGCDNCPNDANPNQADADEDGMGDVCDDCTDTDGDGYGNPGFPLNTCDEDNCPDDANPGQEDVGDGDGVGDACDDCTDTDGDGYGNPGFPLNTCDEDNCPDTPNTSQLDTRPDVPNDCGDACECEADLNGDGEVQGLDTIIYKAGYPRSYYLGVPCAVCIGGSNDGVKCLSDAECPDGDCGQNPMNPCVNDLNCDMEVSGLDTIIYKEDYPRTQWLGVPCPACSRSGYPCTYPE